MKRLFDVTLILLAAPLWVPLLALTALVVASKMGRPVLFRQVRPGWHGKPFTLLKFRTMTSDRDENGNLLPDAARLTSFGKWLRTTSLDELPELLNVLAGDMSLVGPRPLLTQYLERYSPRQSRRHEVKPGITGWAQVNGRNRLDWDEKLELDVWYVENHSWGLDFTILLRTFSQVLHREGINAADSETAPEFMGKRNS